MRIELLTTYRRRVGKFIDHLRQSSAPLTDFAPMQARYCTSPRPIPFAERLRQEYRKAEVGTVWGEAWDSAWFHLQGTVPAEWDGRKMVAHLNFNGESCIFDERGCPLFGLTNASVFAQHYGKDLYYFQEPCRGGRQVELWVEAAANHLFGIDRDADPARDCPRRHGSYQGKVVAMELALFDDQVWHLLLDLEVLFGLFNTLAAASPQTSGSQADWGTRKTLPEIPPRARRLLHALNRAIDAYADDRANAAAAREVLAEMFATPAHASDSTVVAVGHAHIDTGWLWPVKESIRKCGRTFASQVALLEKYPDYVFGASQPQHYQFVKQHYPELYEKIRRHVKDGRWELQGGMWVEADCNIISGESMVRQFLHGKNFFMDEFGVEVKNLWIPDVFGYSAALPQIMKKAGVDYFLTQKMSWSQFNQFPHTTFRWRGIDGSEVLTHFPPENTYNSAMTPASLVPAQGNFKESHLFDEFVSLYGIGDGGGGPKEEHVERGRRLRDLEGCPRVRFGRADQLFETLAREWDQLEVWDDELYLELHRGTLTTQARVKQGNRALERKLREVEFIYAARPWREYPTKALDEIWKTLLINQFHDILPGSSIRLVYQDTEREYEQATAACRQLIAAAGCPRTNDRLALVNPLATAFVGAVELPEAWIGKSIRTDQGEVLPGQVEPGKRLVVRVAIPPCSALQLRAGEETPGQSLDEAAVESSELILENELIRYRFAPNGQMTSCFDKELQYEFIAREAAGNLFSLYVDRPAAWDAWDIDISYEHELLGHPRAAAAPTGFSGPVRQALRFDLAIGQSRIRQTVCLEPQTRRLDFQTCVDWRERHKMLRVSFPLAVQSREATFDIQFGLIKRPTHRNTSWDMGKFEVAAHKYADLSDRQMGAALLNDCKYGYKVTENVVDLNLLRSPTHPDADADLGEHRFAYAFLPHAGILEDSSVIDEAAKFNQPPIAVPGAQANDLRPKFAVEGDGIALEACKKAEKEDCLVVRLVESRGRRGSCTLRLPQTMRLIPCDLMEWRDQQACVGQTHKIEFKPCEIKTFKIKPEPACNEKPNH